MKDHKTLLQRIKEHKKEGFAFTIGCGIGVTGVTVFQYLNERHGSRQYMPVAQTPFQIPGQFVTDAAIPVIGLTDSSRTRHSALPHGVGKHPRNLPNG